MPAAFRTASLAILTIGLIASSVQKARAIDGTAASTAVVAPTYVSPTHTTASSFIQLFNGGTASSTFTLTVVGIPSGTTYGSQVSIAIPANASVQYAVEEIVRRSGSTPGTFLGTDTGYAVYVVNTSKTAGYRHIVYDPVTDLYENHSNCQALINEQMTPERNRVVLTNLHSTKITGFPSSIEVHNPSQTAVALTLSLYNAGIPSATGAPVANAGKLTCTISRTVQGNSRLGLSIAAFEASPGCVIDDDQFQHNVAITTATGAPPNLKLAHLLGVSKFNGVSNVTEMCAVNKLETTVAAPATPTAYCGTTSQPSPFGAISTNFVASIGTNGRIRGTAYGVFQGEEFGVYGVGQVAGTSFLVVATDGTVLTGTVQNGTVSGTFPGLYATGTFSATTAGCNN
jgi:hypothetical protein